LAAVNPTIQERVSIGSNGPNIDQTILLGTEKKESQSIIFRLRNTGHCDLFIRQGLVVQLRAR